MQPTKDLEPLTLEDIRAAAKKCNAWRIYLHWTAGHYGQAYEDYHLNIDHDGKIYTCDDELDFDVKKNHTWQRNSGAIGIALCGSYDATPGRYGSDTDYGSEPVTQQQIESMAAVVATICKYANISINSVQTHCEAAFEDDYGPGSGDPETRWDLWYLPDWDGKRRIGGDVIRGKARWYYEYV